MDSNTLWKIYHKDVLHFILSKVNDKQHADDLVQETFIKAYTKIESLKNKDKAKSWLLSIARNTTLDYFRKAKKEVPLLDNDTAEEPFEVNKHTEEDCLQGIIKSLPKKYRTPLFLNVIKGMKQTEIAKKLGLPLSTVKSQIQRAKKLVANGFVDCCDYTFNEKGYLVGEVKDKKDCKVCN